MLPQEGARIRLIAMFDSHPVEPGTLGTVIEIRDGDGFFTPSQVWVEWDNGRTLPLLAGVDEYEVVPDEANLDARGSVHGTVL